MPYDILTPHPMLGQLPASAAPPRPGALFGAPPGVMTQFPPNRMPPNAAALQRPTDAYNDWAAQLRQSTPDPRQQTWQQMLGSALLPALFGKFATGDSWKSAATYGVGSAAHNYNKQLDDWRSMEAQIANAGLGLPQAEADYTKTLAEAESLTNPALRTQPRRSGTNVFQTWQDMGFPYLDDPENATPETINQAFQKFAQEYSQSTGAPKILGSPFGDKIVGPGGNVIAAAPGELSPESIEAAIDKESGVSAGKTRAELNEKQWDVLTDANYSMREAERVLGSVLEKLQKTKDTGPASEYLAAVDSDLQILRALLTDQVLAKVAQARAAGVTFGAMTVAEWQMLGETVAKLGNSKKANIAIVSAQLEKVRRQLAENRTRLRGFPAGADQRPATPKEGTDFTSDIGSRMEQIE